MLNDAMFYKEISVRKNTPYKVTCMVKTSNVVGNNAFASINLIMPFLFSLLPKNITLSPPTYFTSFNFSKGFKTNLKSDNHGC